jgi:hypothetical protein
LYADTDPEDMNIQQVAAEDAEACRYRRLHERVARQATDLEARVQSLRGSRLSSLPTSQRGVDDARRTLILLAEASQCNNEVLGGRFIMRQHQEERRWDYPAHYRRQLPAGAPGALGSEHYVASAEAPSLGAAGSRSQPPVPASQPPPQSPASTRPLSAAEAMRGRAHRSNSDGDGPPRADREPTPGAGSSSDPYIEQGDPVAGPSSASPREDEAIIHASDCLSFADELALGGGRPRQTSEKPTALTSEGAPPGSFAEELAALPAARGGLDASGSVTSSPPSMPTPKRMRTAEAGGVQLAAPAYERGRGGVRAQARRADLDRALQERARLMTSEGGDSGKVLQGLRRAADFAELGAASGTLDKDDLAWEHWRLFCAEYGWDPNITRAEAAAPDLVASRLGLFYLWVYPRIRGRRLPDANPRSVLNSYPTAIVRVFTRDHRLPMPKQKTWEGEMKGTLRSYVRIYGPLALAKGKRQPITRPMWAKVEALEKGRPMAGRRPWMAKPHDDATVLRLGRVLWKTGHRLGEIVEYSATEANYLTRAHASYLLSGVVKVNPTEDELRRAKPGDRVLLAPCASKPDQFGEAHCIFPSVLTHDGSDSSAFAAIRDIDLERPCHGDSRKNTPLFAREDGRPYHYSQLNKMLHDVIAALFGEAVARTISWHSFRIGLACALRAANCPDEKIQILVRWLSPESIRAYADIGLSEHDHWLALAENARVDSVRVANLPQLDNSEGFAEIIDPAMYARTPTRAHAVQPPGAPTPLPPPCLTAGSRVEVLWGDTYFAGTFTSSRAGLDTDGNSARLYRIMYDRTGAWKQQARWHALDSDENAWRRLP